VARSPYTRLVSTLVCFLSVVAATTLLLNAQATPARPAAPPPMLSSTVRVIPAEIRDTSWLEARRAAELSEAAGLTTFHDFQFADRAAESGITFRNRIVADAGKDYKAVHYDHGNGVAVADVDGDGRLDVYMVSQVGGNELWR
jgi:hypothetical protein